MNGTVIRKGFAFSNISNMNLFGRSRSQGEKEFQNKKEVGFRFAEREQKIHQRAGRAAGVGGVVVT